MTESNKLFRNIRDSDYKTLNDDRHKLNMTWTQYLGYLASIVDARKEPDRVVASAFIIKLKTTIDETLDNFEKEI